MNKIQLLDVAGIRGDFIDKIDKNQLVAFKSLVKIAKTLGVDISDIISIEKSNIKK